MFFFHGDVDLSVTKLTFGLASASLIELLCQHILWRTSPTSILVARSLNCENFSEDHFGNHVAVATYFLRYPATPTISDLDQILSPVSHEQRVWWKRNTPAVANDSSFASVMCRLFLIPKVLKQSLRKKGIKARYLYCKY